MLRNNEGRINNPTSGQQSTEQQIIESQSNNFIFSVLLNSISQSGQSGMDQPTHNSGMEFESLPDNRDNAS